MVPSGIRFDDYIFSEPTSLAEWRPPRCAGLFVILAKDSNWAPKPFQALYFGEFGNNTEALLPGSYAWMLGTQGGTALFVSVLPMPFTTINQRCEIRDRLLRAYNPLAQSRAGQAAACELADKLHEVEKSPREEQTAQLLLLLAGAGNRNAMLEGAPRRRIGFLP